mmetsp:Transcript_1136/g.2986  ORF Transcript_1136/g.2986 Transcript_1136/m.2986 type:complete len:639 (-) Transcript_1136:5-1921(-)
MRRVGGLSGRGRRREGLPLALRRAWPCACALQVPRPAGGPIGVALPGSTVRVRVRREVAISSFRPARDSRLSTTQIAPAPFSSRISFRSAPGVPESWRGGDKHPLNYRLFTTQIASAPSGSPGDSDWQKWRTLCAGVLDCAASHWLAASVATITPTDKKGGAGREVTTVPARAENSLPAMLQLLRTAGVDDALQTAAASAVAAAAVANAGGCAARNVPAVWRDLSESDETDSDGHTDSDADTAAAVANDTDGRDGTVADAAAAAADELLESRQSEGSPATASREPDTFPNTNIGGRAFERRWRAHARAALERALPREPLSVSGLQTLSADTEELQALEKESGVVAARLAWLLRALQHAAVRRELRAHLAWALLAPTQQQHFQPQQQQQQQHQPEQQQQQQQQPQKQQHADPSSIVSFEANSEQDPQFSLEAKSAQANQVDAGWEADVGGEWQTAVGARHSLRGGGAAGAVAAAGVPGLAGLGALCDVAQAADTAAHRTARAARQRPPPPLLAEAIEWVAPHVHVWLKKGGASLTAWAREAAAADGGGWALALADEWALPVACCAVDVCSAVAQTSQALLALPAALIGPRATCLVYAAAADALGAIADGGNGRALLLVGRACERSAASAGEAAVGNFIH